MEANNNKGVSYDYQSVDNEGLQKKALKFDKNVLSVVVQYSYYIETLSDFHSNCKNY